MSVYNCLFSEYYNAECWIDNPFFIQEPMQDCQVCENFKHLKVINASNFTTLKFSAFASTMKPVHLKVENRNFKQS